MTADTLSPAEICRKRPLGDTVEEALAVAVDALDEAICGRINQGREIPEPSAKQVGEHLVPVPMATAVKVAAYIKI